MDKLIPIEHRGQRVLTTQQLAEKYETTEVRIRQNFSENQDRYKEGVHYFRLVGEELRVFRDYVGNSYVVDPRAPHLYLWTEKGCLLHAKSLNTDKAWEVYQYLVDHYFRTKDLMPVQPLTQLQILKRAIDILEEHDGRLKQIETSHATLKETLAAHPDDWRQTIVDGVKRIAKATNRWHQLIWDEFYTLLEERGRCDLHRRLDNLRERMEDAGATWTRIHYRTNRLDTIEADPRLREIALAIIKEMVAKYVV